MDAQMGINPWNLRPNDPFRQTFQPPLGLPLVGISTPDIWIPVGAKDRREDFGAFRYKHLCHLFAVVPNDGFRERENSI